MFSDDLFGWIITLKIRKHDNLFCYLKKNLYQKMHTYTLPKKKRLILRKKMRIVPHKKKEKKIK